MFRQRFSSSNRGIGQRKSTEKKRIYGDAHSKCLQTNSCCRGGAAGLNCAGIGPSPSRTHGGPKKAVTGWRVFRTCSLMPLFSSVEPFNSILHICLSTRDPYSLQMDRFAKWPDGFNVRDVFSSSAEIARKKTQCVDCSSSAYTKPAFFAPQIPPTAVGG